MGWGALGATELCRQDLSKKRGIDMKSLACIVLGIGLAVPALGTVAAAADQPPLTGSLAGSAPAPAAATAVAPIALEADGVTFGMSSDQVAKLYDRWWDRYFIPKYQKANPGPKTKELDYQLEEQKKVLRRVAPFDGRTTTFDKADFREEFAHGNGETMSSTKVRRGATSDSKSVSYTRRFFFFQDKLWKVYDEYRLEAQGPFGADFKEATSRVAASLGPSAKRTRAPASSTESVAFDAATERVRVIKLSGERVAVVRADSALAKTVLDGRAQHPVAQEAGVDEDTSAALR
jgi:hypothetical protein